MKRNYFFLILLLVACSKGRDAQEFSAYYPDLMDLDVIRTGPHSAAARIGENETQMEVIGLGLYILDQYNGVSVARASNNLRFSYYISPGASYIVPAGGGISVDRTVDLATFYGWGYIGAQTNVLDELQPPDGKAIPPIFQRDKRLSNTEIIRWQK